MIGKIVYRTRAIITRDLYASYHVRLVFKSDFKSRAGYSGARTVYVPGLVNVINGDNYFLNILDFDQDGYSNVMMIISWTFSNLKLIFIALTSLQDRI